MRGRSGTGWRQALAGLAVRTGPDAPSPGRRTVPVPVRRDGSGRPRHRRGEQPMVPEAEFSSYYGRPVIKEPVWEPADVAGYLCTGG